MIPGKSKSNTIKKERIIFIIILSGTAFFLYLLFLFNLQVVHGFEYEKKAKQVASRVLPIPAQRGEIFDRHFTIPLVTNIDSFAVNIIPAELSIKEEETLFLKLSDLLNISIDDIKNELPSNYSHLYQPIEIADGVDFNTIAYIAEHIEDFQGVTWHNKSARNYLETHSFSHILGFVGDITTEEFQVLYNEGYNINDTIGKIGIEKQYDKELRGTNGRSYSTVDVQGRLIEDVKIEDIPPVNGNNLVLTIDRSIQKLCEEALGERIGSVVVLKPSTGEILAMVSYPWYNPNLFYRADVAEEMRELSLDSRKPFLNRVIQSGYVPASTFKVVMTTAVLEEEIFSPLETILCEGTLLVGNQYFDCHNKRGHGSLNLREGLAESCNVYFFNMGQKLGIDLIAEYSFRFGFGEKTGIDIPGEISGLIPSPEWKERIYNSRWVGGDTMNTSIGQGFLGITPLQMANMIALVVNEGYIYVPHLLKEIRDPLTGKIIKEITPEILNRATLRTETLQTVKEYLRNVITEGTAGSTITTKAVEIAGKTGTGQMGLEDNWHAWFAAYGPYDTLDTSEQVVVVTMVEGINDTWEWWAIKAANIIFQGIFANETYDEAIDSLNQNWLRNERSPE